MFNKIGKIILFMQVLHKKELLKRVEYKIKDFSRYFYIRKQLQIKRKCRGLYPIKIEMDFATISFEDEEKKYKIFNQKCSCQDIIKNLEVEKKFWRKIKLNQYEEIKVIWEYNRLQILLPLTIKYLKTKKDTDKKAIEQILETWRTNNPFENTLNWNSNLEVAIRAINIALALLLLQNKELDEYSQLLYLHAKHIYSEINYSDCCIPNNHVIGEATALLLLSRILNVKENKKWYKKAINILIKYVNIIDEEGVSKENSFSYQFFVTKMYILSLCFVEENDKFAIINEKVIKSLNVLKYARINETMVLNYGDNDDGFLFSIDMTYNLAKDIEQYYNLFFKNEYSNETIIYVKLLKTLNPSKKLIVGEERASECLITKNIFIYKWNDNMLFFNAKKIEGHAHNDSLAINLVINGEMILLDGGTYSYNKSIAKRNYNRSRNAHTTVLLEELNAIPIGKFRWKNKKKAFIEEIEDFEQYIKINGIIKKQARREILIYKNENKIQIIDFNESHKAGFASNWILPFNSNIKENKVMIKNVEIEYEKCDKIEQEEVKIAKQFLQEEKAKCYKANYQERIGRTNIRWE